MKILAAPFSNGEINRAAEILVREQIQNAKFVNGDAFLKVAAWRLSHAYPLRVVSAILDQHATKYGDWSASTSARLKRMESIISKLQRAPTMQATTMQDVGGCRTVVESIDQLNALANHYRKDVRPELEGEPRDYDYISKPKTDGYRGMHFVVGFRPRSRLDVPSRRIEIQIRTRLQHEWAMAVETVDLFAKQTLKVGGGNPKWRRFFALVGSMFAISENCPTVPNTPNRMSELIAEIQTLWRELHIFVQLAGWSLAMRIIKLKSPPPFPPAAIYLVELDTEKKTTNVSGFFKEYIDDAHAAYTTMEQRNLGNPNHVAVLVSAHSVDAIQRSFPSYYGDTRAFITEVIKQAQLTESDCC